MKIISIIAGCFCFLSIYAQANDFVHIPHDVAKLEMALKKLNPQLVVSKVRNVFEYSCDRTFFEGEGVTQQSISCPAGQRLGVLSSKYYFYLYNSYEDNNFPGFSYATFDGSICDRTDFLKWSCSGSPQLKFGLYRESVSPFVVRVTLTKAPEGENVTSNYGYAALPNADGSCPEGLVSIRAFRADPESIFMNDPSLGGNNPPSSFINANGHLSDTRVGQSMLEAQPVFRQKNANRCEGNPPPPGMNVGSCLNASFGQPELVRSAIYKPLAPMVCALPPEIL